MLDPVKVGLSELLVGFHSLIFPTTKALEQFVLRPTNLAYVWGVSRLYDSPEEILAMWTGEDSAKRGDRHGVSGANTGAPITPYKMPIIGLIMGRTVSPPNPDRTKNVTLQTYGVLDGDLKCRVFRSQTFTTKVTCKIFIAANEVETCQSLAMQLIAYLNDSERRVIHSTYRFSGIDYSCPTNVSSDDWSFTDYPTGAKNQIMLTTELTLEPSITLISAPLDSEPNDGKGTNGNPDDRHGYLIAEQIQQIDQDNGYNHTHLA